MKRFLLLVFWMAMHTCGAQQFWVQMNVGSEEVNAEDLDPPFTAGADYQHEIFLQVQASVAVTDLPEDAAWCLSAQRLGQSSGNASLVVVPDYTTVGYYQYNPSSPVKATIGNVPVAVFSGIGPVQNLLISFLLEGATLKTDWQIRSEEILWTVKNEKCLI